MSYKNNLLHFEFSNTELSNLLAVFVRCTEGLVAALSGRNDAEFRDYKGKKPYLFLAREIPILTFFYIRTELLFGTFQGQRCLY